MIVGSQIDTDVSWESMQLLGHTLDNQEVTQFTFQIPEFWKNKVEFIESILVKRARGNDTFTYSIEITPTWAPDDAYVTDSVS